MGVKKRTDIGKTACGLAAIITLTQTSHALQSGPEKNARSFMHRHFATVCIRITRFSPKSLEKMTVPYQSMQNLYQFVINSLINNQN